MATMPQVKIITIVYKPWRNYFKELYLGAPIPSGMVLVRYKGAKNPYVDTVYYPGEAHVHVAKRYQDYCIIPVQDYETLAKRDQFKAFRFG